MNIFGLTFEIWVVALGLLVLLADFWTPPAHKWRLGLASAWLLFIMLLVTWRASTNVSILTFSQSYVIDGLALFFKRFFFVAAILVLVMTVGFAEKLGTGLAEYCALTLFALAGMMLAASANHFAVLFVALELITVTFYVLVSFQRRCVQSLEAGVKYLIIGALSSGFLIYGIALVYGASGSLSFEVIAQKSASLADKPLFLLGLLLIFVGLGFKIAMVPFQIWVPDVYQGSPTPTTAFLAVGSKAAGFVLLLRLLQFVVPEVAAHWQKLLMVLAGLTILYGNLCAIPQRNLKRLLGYSSIANAGYLLMGVAAMTQAGSAAILYYLSGYLFTLLAAFTVIAIILQQTEVEDITALAGLNQRSPFLAAAMTLAMVSLAGVPPLAGFFGKFLLLKAVLEQGAANHAFYWLAGIAIVGVVISLYYYFGVIRAIYWSKDAGVLAPLPIAWTNRCALLVCMAGMLYLGILPNRLVELAAEAVKSLRLA
ncbi:MAG: NADH-quinone oxidoreductase subunit N [Verrucomicrobia bacterium]|nr:NADH-quinone oxidoreductase subunit N [Verrucomicrobiota bacterium]